MAKRMILMLGVAAVLLTGLGFLKFKQIHSAVQAAAFQPPPEAVTSVVAHREQWPATLNVIGTMEAVQGVTVSADLPGAITRVAFDSGKSVQAGDILVELDTRQERAQLASLEAQRDLAKVNFGRMQQLVNDGVISRMEYDQALSQQKATEANVAEIRATIDRKTIKAPFSGILGIRQVNLGQYLSAGQAIVSLQALSPIYVNFGVPQQTLSQMIIGHAVRVAKEDLPSAAFSGRVTAVDSVVNEATRNIQIQATLPNPDGKLRPGMFVQVEVPLGAARSVIALPASAINYAPYGDSVFVKVEGSRGDQVAIVSGINPGDEVVTSGVFKLRNGAAVQVNNKVQPGNNPAPKPEDS
jgi:membrane fusion protein, multidrug efflux system